MFPPWSSSPGSAAIWVLEERIVVLRARKISKALDKKKNQKTKNGAGRLWRDRKASTLWALQDENQQCLRTHLWAQRLQSFSSTSAFMTPLQSTLTRVITKGAKARKEGNGRYHGGQEDSVQSSQGHRWQAPRMNSGGPWKAFGVPLSEERLYLS